MSDYKYKFNGRRSVRLEGYDYTQAGMYFITICCQNMECLFGNVTNGVMILNPAGEMIESYWLNLIEDYSNIKLYEYVVMPNHFHGIIDIVEMLALKHKKLGEMIGSFKSKTTCNYIQNVKTLEWQPFKGKIWQRNYYEHIIQNEESYKRISEYIINNPTKWG
jgi:REP element-mobilizing transposase RayT